VRHLRPGAHAPGARPVTLVAVAVAVAVAVTLASFVLAGCSYQESTCMDGEYPAVQVDGPGSYCVPDGHEPDPGFVRYPADKVPQHVGDEWDVYWRTHRLDAQGNEITAGPALTASPATSAAR
jgi:hypothetical protein